MFDKRFNVKCDNIDTRKGKYTDIDRGKVEGVDRADRVAVQVRREKERLLFPVSQDYHQLIMIMPI